ncbi:MAG: hypothetical protein CMH83_19420 [Nocardioides sp.]|nr:hypothetical protein [Nocardioides sp.]MBS45294.1 hypothetical protein [Nocardioides sp.]
MPQTKTSPSDLVRVRRNGRESTTTRFFANRDGSEVITEPAAVAATHNPDGSIRGVTGLNGRPLKERTSPDQEVLRKQLHGETAEQLKDRIRVLNDAREADQQLPLTGNKDELITTIIAAGDTTENKE